jgi:hypothetical protein
MALAALAIEYEELELDDEAPGHLSSRDTWTLKYLWRDFEADVGCRSLHQAMIDGIHRIQGTRSSEHDFPIERFCFKDRPLRDRISGAYRALCTLSEEPDGPGHVRVLYRVYGPRIPNARTRTFGLVAPLIEYTPTVIAFAEATRDRERRAAAGSRSAFWAAESRRIPARARQLEGEMIAQEVRVVDLRAELETAAEAPERRRALKGALLRAYLEGAALRDEAVSLQRRIDGLQRSPGRLEAPAAHAAAIDTGAVVRKALDRGVVRVKSESATGFVRRRRSAELERRDFVARVKHEAEVLLCDASNAYRRVRYER